MTSDSLLTTIVSDDPVYASFDADEQAFLRYSRHVANRAAGYRAANQTADVDPVYMGLADEKDFPHAGRLNFVDNQVDRKTGTIRARAVFANAEGIFTPGLFVRIRLVSSETHDAVLIDDRAVGTDLGKKFVLVLRNDSTVDYRNVTLGSNVDGMRIVTGGLKPGDVIVVNGLQRVRPCANAQRPKWPGYEQGGRASSPLRLRTSRRMGRRRLTDRPSSRRNCSGPQPMKLSQFFMTGRFLPACYRQSF